MEVPELSLAPTSQFVKTPHDDIINSSSPKLPQITNSTSNKKRKLLLLHDHHHQSHQFVKSQTSVDLQLKDPLPLDWEQCLDLQSGKMYYLNRKTLRKSWNWPKLEDHPNQHHQKLDLELELNNINNNSSSSSIISSSTKADHHHHHNNLINLRHGHGSTYSASASSESSCNMVALPCLNCHLLVILSKSSPSCPNCKHLHTPFPTSSPNNNNSSPPNTLSLLI